MKRLQGFRQILLKNKNHPFDYTYLSDALQFTHHLLSIKINLGYTILHLHGAKVQGVDLFC